MPVSCERDCRESRPNNERGQASCMARSEKRSSSFRPKRSSKKAVNAGSSTESVRPSGVATSARKQLNAGCWSAGSGGARKRGRNKIISRSIRPVIHGKLDGFVGSPKAYARSPAIPAYVTKTSRSSSPAMPLKGYRRRISTVPSFAPLATEEDGAGHASNASGSAVRDRSRRCLRKFDRPRSRNQPRSRALLKIQIQPGKIFIIQRKIDIVPQIAFQRTRGQVELHRSRLRDVFDVREPEFLRRLEIGHHFRSNLLVSPGPDSQHARLARHFAPLIRNVVHKH